MIGKEIHSRLHSFTDCFRGNKKANDYLTLIRKMLKPYNVKVKKIIDKNNTADSITTIGGFYNCECDSDSEIEIYFVVNAKEKDNIFNLSDKDINFVIDELFRTYIHEKRHEYQYENRDYIENRSYRTYNQFVCDDMEYYGGPDELDAHAIEAAIETQLTGKSTIVDRYKTIFVNEPKTLNNFYKKYYKALNETE